MIQRSLSIALLTSLGCVCALPQALRLDDNLPEAVVEASNVASSAAAAEPVIWQNFAATSDITWQLVRGRIGVHNGDLMLKGDGATPVILAPKQPAIDWTLYQAVEISMSAQSGSEIKIKIGDFEAKQKLGQAGQYNIYRFPVNVDAPKGSRLLGLMPTDSLDGIVAIHSIKLIPKPANFPRAFDRAELGKQDEYRHVVYVHCPARITYHVDVPPGGHLHFGMGTTSRGSAIRFQVSVDGAASDLFSKTLDRADQWEDADVELPGSSGRSIKLQLRAESAHDGDVALWANPLVTRPALKARPNILIYTSDTLRADHASLYGYGRDTTPFLKKLGASGIVFEDCQAQSSWTKPSIASLMTSLYAFTHGIVAESDTIPPGASTLAEELRKAGYVTANIASSPFTGRSTGLNRGFDYTMESPVILRQVNPPVDRGTDSAALNRVVFPWLAQHRNEPFFLYAHATDPHAPYNPPEPFESTFANAADTPAFEKHYAFFRTNQEYGGGAVISPAMCRKAAINPDAFIHQAVDRYDGEILHNDRSFELLIAQLKQLGILDNTLVIVISDHGEEFWDHGWTSHAHTVYQELTHTMLLMWNPKLLPSARRVSEPVQLIDVMPTVLDLLGLKTPPVAEGQSVLPLARGQSFKRRGLVVSSRFAAVHQEGLVPENAVDDFAVIDARWKFIYRNKAAKAAVKKVELYDRRNDRTEQHDLSDAHPRETEDFIATLGQWIDAQNKVRQIVGHAGISQTDQQTLEQLRSLGYLEKSSQ